MSLRDMASWDNSSTNGPANPAQRGDLNLGVVVQEQAARNIVEQATRAPSIHNTQPWRFAIHADTIELWTDPARGLKVLDPTGKGRQRWVVRWKPALNAFAIMFEGRIQPK